MGSLSPLQVVLLIVAALSVAGIIIVLIRNRNTFAGYEEYAAAAREVAGAMRGEVFRDHEDVVMFGNYRNLPAVVRLSNGENTPGLIVRMQAPVTFSLSVVPAGTPLTEGARAALPTRDSVFDARFTVRSDQPTQAKMFLTRQTQASLQRLCCSSKTYVSIDAGAIELSELVIPQPETGKHIQDHLKHMAILAENLREMPGADRVAVVPFRRERHVAGRIAIAIGAIVALASVFAATRVPMRPSLTSPKLPAGITPADAAMIPDITHWRLATEDDFDPITANWLRGNGIRPQGRISGDFSGTGHGRDFAFLLVGPDNSRRIVLVVDGVAHYDAQFSSLGGIARLPKDSLGSIQWVRNNPPPKVDGDGLLLIRNGADPASAVALFLDGGRIVFASPAKYDSINNL